MMDTPRSFAIPGWTPAWLFALFALTWGGPAARAAEEVYAPPAAQELKTAVFEWIELRKLEHTPVVDAVTPYWEFEGTPSPDDLFDALMRTFYLADADVRKLVDACREWTFSPSLSQAQLPPAARDEPLLTNNVRYFLARHLTRLRAYNEALDVFEEIDVRAVVDPAGCLFHQAVCEHHLLLKERGLETLAKLLDRTESLSVRHRRLGELMQQDLIDLKEKSLGEVARQMKDAERRLSLRKSDQDALELEERILATLDEMIKQLEEQQQQSSASSAGAAQSQPSNPADDSYLGGVQGRGETDKKEIGHKDNWGDLPDKEREAAKNLLDRQFPSHYRQAVEEYLKKLADRPAPQR